MDKPNGLEILLEKCKNYDFFIFIMVMTTLVYCTYKCIFIINVTFHSLKKLSSFEISTLCLATHSRILP